MRPLRPEVSRRVAAPAVGCLAVLVGLSSGLTPARAGGAAVAEHPLHVGWATADITPTRPVALVGQLNKRISTGVKDPITATVLALETRDGAAAVDQAVLVSMDLISSPREIQGRLRERVRGRAPGLDVAKIVINATHTHTAPGLLDGKFKGLYDVSGDKGVMKASEYAEFFLDRVADAVVRAWDGRKPGALSWGLGHAVVGLNRRAQYFDGKTVMYGDTRRPDFASVEGHTDHDLDLLFLWDAAGKLTGLVVNLPCPSQETEALTVITADFWHDVRVELRKRHGDALFVLPQCAAAGDQSPHLISRKAATQVMDARRGLSRRQEIARRVVNAIDDVWPVARADVKDRIVFRHAVARFNLSEHTPPNPPFYETDPVRPVEVHVLRLGDVALATNPFELYVDYADRIEARSKAVTTLLVQLCSGDSGYLPTERAVKGGGYSADRFVVGPEGGKQLVDETVKIINELWP